MSASEEHVEPTQVIPFMTPVNLVLLALALYLAYVRLLRPSQVPVIPAAEPLVYQTFTPRTLLPYNGIDDPRILMGVRGKVFDVTPGKGFYGPGASYHIFAGRDASRGLAKGDLDDSLLTDINEKLDTLTDLTEDENEALDGWIARFEAKYLEVGELVNNE